VISLTDHQQTVMAAASMLDIEKSATFLERVGAQLRLQAGRHSDSDVARACDQALRSLGAATAA
jgi:hypothetical protein